MQVEYANRTLVFRSSRDAQAALTQHLARESVLSVKGGADRQLYSAVKISPQLAQEIGSQFSTRIEGDLHQTPLWPVPRSRMYEQVRLACSASRRQSTTSPSSSTTARWNIGQGPPNGGSSPPGQEDHLQPD